MKKLKIVNIILILILCIYMVIGFVGIRWLNGKLEGTPEMHVADYVSQESTRVYDAHGNMIQETGVYLRNNISYDDCPEALVDAFLAIEDSRFFTHPGVDFARLLKAAYGHFQGNSDAGGASTFTMQLVKNTYFSVEAGDDSTVYDQSVQYKLQQSYLALQTDHVLNKKKIFELYVNKLNFGNNVRGVEWASEYYYGKSVSQLNLNECAMLAGLINLPNLYNPYEHLDYAQERRDTVIDSMVSHGYLTEQQGILAKSVKVEDLLMSAKENPFAQVNQYQAYVDTALQEAQVLTGMDPMLVGMDIYTAMEPDVQSQIEAIQNGYSIVKFFDDELQTAIISINNRNGEIIGIGAGRNYNGSMLFNRATSGYYQPGSTVKPFLSYALAFEYLGYTLDETVTDKPYLFEGRFITNATNQYWGDLSLRKAVAYSLNMPALYTLEKVIDKVGDDTVISYLNTLGFTQVNKDDFDIIYAIGGDSFTVTVEQLAAAHAAMINLGIYNEPHTIRKVQTTKHGSFEPSYESRRVLSSGSCYLADQLMEYNVSSGEGHNMEILQREYPVYAKTGTTDWGEDGLQYGIPKSAAKDCWMVSSSNNYTNAVWIGWDKAVEGGNNYFTLDQRNMNIPGAINSMLLGTEEVISTDIMQGVLRPDDVVDVPYGYGTTQMSQAGIDSTRE